MQRLIRSAVRLVRKDDGQDLVEYGMLAALITIAAVIAVTTLGTTITQVFWNTIAAANA